MLAPVSSAPYTRPAGPDLHRQRHGGRQYQRHFLLGFYLPGDANGNGMVNKADIQLVKSEMNTNNRPKYNFNADTNRDGRIGKIDLAFTLQNQGVSTTISPVVSANWDTTNSIGTSGTQVTNVPSAHFTGKHLGRRDDHLHRFQHSDRSGEHDRRCVGQLQHQRPAGSRRQHLHGVVDGLVRSNDLGRDLARLVHHPDPVRGGVHADDGTVSPFPKLVIDRLPFSIRRKFRRPRSPTGPSDAGGCAR